MGDSMSHEQIVDLVNRVLTGESKRVVLPEESAPARVVVVPVKSTGGRRPDGLREDVVGDPGFSFAVGEGMIEVDSSLLNTEQFEQVHRILWEAGTDDFMDYSELMNFDAKDVAAGTTVCLSFSSSQKGSACHRSNPRGFSQAERPDSRFE